MAEDVVDSARQPIDKPLLAVEVVHRERAVRRQVRARNLDGLLRKEVALKPQRTCSGHERERVGQREEDQVVLRVCLLEERPAVVDMTGDSRVLIGMVGVVLLTKPQQRRVDLDGIDVLDAVCERDRDIGAGAGADDEHVLRDRRDPVVGLEVPGLLFRPGGR